MMKVLRPDCQWINILIKRRPNATVVVFEAEVRTFLRNRLCVVESAVARETRCEFISGAAQAKGGHSPEGMSSGPGDDGGGFNEIFI
jgi:hypothetical protein